jgi:hypothetical protein
MTAVGRRAGLCLVWELVTVLCVGRTDAGVTSADSRFPISLNGFPSSPDAPPGNPFHAAISFRSTNFCTLPVTVIGNESTNST